MTQLTWKQKIDPSLILNAIGSFVTFLGLCINIWDSGTTSLCDSITCGASTITYNCPDVNFEKTYTYKKVGLDDAGTIGAVCVVLYVLTMVTQICVYVRIFKFENNPLIVAKRIQQCCAGSFFSTIISCLAWAFSGKTCHGKISYMKLGVSWYFFLISSIVYLVGSAIAVRKIRMLGQTTVTTQVQTTGMQYAQPTTTAPNVYMQPNQQQMIQQGQNTYMVQQQPNQMQMQGQMQPQMQGQMQMQRQMQMQGQMQGQMQYQQPQQYVVPPQQQQQQRMMVNVQPNQTGNTMMMNNQQPQQYVAPPQQYVAPQQQQQRMMVNVQPNQTGNTSMMNNQQPIQSGSVNRPQYTPQPQYSLQQNEIEGEGENDNGTNENNNKSTNE